MLLRFRSAAILCFVLIGGMLGLPALIWAIFLPSLKQGLPNPLPAYEKILLDFAAFCGKWKWFPTLPVIVLGLSFTIIEVKASRARG
jgi:type II secretory pathway component PulF